MHKLEYDMLKMEGYIPENVQACRDYKNGVINLSHLWSVLNKNIDLTSILEQDRPRHQTKPRPKDVVVKQTDDGPAYGRILWIDYESQVVNVAYFLEDGVEEYSLDDFINYSSKGGRTSWQIG